MVSTLGLALSQFSLISWAFPRYRLNLSGFPGTKAPAQYIKGSSTGVIFAFFVQVWGKILKYTFIKLAISQIKIEYRLIPVSLERGTDYKLAQQNITTCIMTKFSLRPFDSITSC